MFLFFLIDVFAGLKGRAHQLQSTRVGHTVDGMLQTPPPWEGRLAADKRSQGPCPLSCWCAIFATRAYVPDFVLYETVLRGS